MIKYLIIGIMIFLAFNLSTALGLFAVLIAIAYILYKNIPFFYARKGNGAFNDGNSQKALECYEKAYNTGRSSADISITYAILLLRNGKPQEAVTVFNLIVMNPKIKDTYKIKAKQYRALAYYKINNLSDALEEAEEVFEDCKNTIGYGLLCYLKLVTGAPTDEVFELCKEAYEYNNDDRDICDNMAVAYIKKGELEEAKKITDEMLDKFPTFTEGYYHGAVAEYKLGNKARASELLNMIDGNCTRTYLTTVSAEEIERFKSELNGENTND